MEVLLCTVALSADADDGYGARLAGHGGLLSVGTLRPLDVLDPTGEKARAVKSRYQGVCRGCGAPTAARRGKGDAYEYCKRCHPGAIAARRTRAWVRDAMHAWREAFGRAPSSTDWSRRHARRRGGEALRRLQDGDWPAPSTVIDLYGTWADARADAFTDN